MPASHHSVFYRLDALPAAQPTASKHWRQLLQYCTTLWTLSRTTRMRRYQKKHSPLTSVVVINHSLSASFIFYDPWHPPCSIYVPDSLFPQYLSKFSLVYLLTWHPPLHTPYICSPNHCLLLAAHVHTIATCFVVVPKLCHLILVSLSTLYLVLSIF